MEQEIAITNFLNVINIIINNRQKDLNNLIIVFLLLLLFYIIDVLFPSFIIYETINE